MIIYISVNNTFNGYQNYLIDVIAIVLTNLLQQFKNLSSSNGTHCRSKALTYKKTMLNRDLWTNIPQVEVWNISIIGKIF